MRLVLMPLVMLVLVAASVANAPSVAASLGATSERLNCALALGFTPSDSPLSDGLESRQAELVEAAIVSGVSNAIAMSAQDMAAVHVTRDGLFVDGVQVEAVEGRAGTAARVVSTLQEELRDRGLMVPAAAVSLSSSPPLRWSLAELCRAYETMIGDAERLMDRGLVAVRLDQHANALIGESVDVQGTRGGLDRLGISHVVRLVPWEGTLPSAAHRSNDVNGFNAGIALNVAGAPCTSSFTLRNNSSGSRYLLTAAHCGTSGVSVRNGNTPSQCWSGLAGNAVVGVLGSHLTGVNTDVAVVSGGSFTSPMWSGSACLGTAESRVLGAIGDPMQGAVIGFSGYVSGERSAAVVDSSAGCYNLSGQLVCNLFRASSTNAAPCQGGDSGGPVFAFSSSGGVYAAGVINGASSVSGGGITRHYCFFTPVRFPSYFYDSSVVTG